MPIPLEEARQRLKRHAQTVSYREMARRMGVPGKYKLISAFVSGEVDRPRAVAEKIVTYAEALPSAPAEPAQSAPAADTPDAPGAAVQLRAGAGDTVPVSRETLGYLRGKLETTVEWLGSLQQQVAAQAASAQAVGHSVHAVGETLLALRHQLDRATSGVAGILAGGQLVPPLPPDEEARIGAAADADVARERAADVSARAAGR